MKRPTAASGDSYVSKMVIYIPTEIIAAYVAVSGFIKGLPLRQQFTWFCIVAVGMLLLTPAYLWSATASPGRKRTLAHPITGAIAFGAWVFATGGPFEHFQLAPDGSSGWYSRAIGSIVLVFVCLMLPVIERALSPRNA
jgi:hypothetical protein